MPTGMYQRRRVTKKIDQSRLVQRRVLRTYRALDRHTITARRESRFARRRAHSWGIIVFYRYKPSSRLFRAHFANTDEFCLWWTALQEDVTIYKEFWPRTYVSGSVKRRAQIFGAAPIFAGFQIEA